MSNLLKFHNIKNEHQQTRVIDSNQKIVARMKELFVTQHNQTIGESGEADGFVEGLYAQQVEVIENEVNNLTMQEEYDEIIERAKAEAENIINQAIEEGVAIKTNARLEGRNQGYEEGFKEGIKEINKMKNELDEKEKQREINYKREVEQIEPILVDLLTDVIERVFHVQFDDKKSMVLHLAKSAMDKIENSKEFIVKVPKENYLFVKERKDELEARVGKSVRVEVIEDMLLKKNQCIIETDSGVFDCSLDIQMERLVKDIKTLSL